MFNKNKNIRMVLSCLIILTIILFNKNYFSYAYENKAKSIIDIEKIHLNINDLISQDYENIKKLLLESDKKYLVKGNINKNLKDTYDLSNQQVNKLLFQKNAVKLLGEDYINYWEIEPNDTIFRANGIDSKQDGSLKHYIFGSITEFYFDIDYYKINLTQKGVLDIMGIWLGDIFKMGWEDDLGIGIKDASGQLIYAAMLKGYGTGTYRHIFEELDAGVYYIMVIQMSDYEYLYTDEFYGISLDFKPYKIHNIVFNSMGGSSTANLLVKNNELIQEPLLPKKTGYTFGGWYKESDLKNIWNFSWDRAIDDMTLYAKWIVNKYVVNFNSDGGSYINGILVDYNELIKLSSSPSKPGYTFGGWYKESKLDNKWNLKDDRVTDNMSLYAKWYTINNDYISILDKNTKSFKEKQTDVDISKTWAIEFNKTLDQSTINNQNIFVWDKINNINLEVIIEYEDNILIIKSPLEFYKTNTDYTIYITENIMSIDGEDLNPAVKFEFKTK